MRRCALASVLACLAAAPGMAQQSDASRVDAAKQLEARREKLQETERKAKNLQADLSQINEDRERINQRLQETARLIQQTEARMTSIEGRLGELEAQEQLVRGTLVQRQGSIAKLLTAMQRMGRNPPPVIITRREDALKMVRSAMLLARAFPELRTQADQLTAQLNQLLAVMTEIRSEGEKLRNETSRLNEARTRLATLMESKRHTLSERQRELEDVRKAANDITRSVQDLSELIAKLDQAVSERTGLGAYEKEMQAQAAAAPPQPPFSAAPAPPAAGGPDPGANTKVAVALPRPPPGPSIELAPKGPLASNPGRMKPAIPFQLAKAQLPMPAQGRRVIGFGDRLQSGNRSQGLVVETRHGAQVTAPCDGWVVYAGAFRSYGQLLIINAGNGYHVLLAGLSQISPQVGQFVLTAEPVGTMVEKLPGKGQDSAPVLLVEFRKDGRPIDPEPWWHSDPNKVQG